MTKSQSTGPILVPVDFSDESAAALEWAAEMAALLEREVLVLHVVHDPAESPGTYAKESGEGLRPMETVAGEMLDKFLARLGVQRSGRLGTRLVTGLPVHRILEVADAIGASQIVMGSRGRTGLPRLLLGSKAERIVRMAPIPVTIVKSEEE